ncbi:MAG: hypothetical protein JJE30_16800 [Desulfuromonadales bacterium]|nr:hypothetical protein [Desulfuromonadales bacterium]
MRSIRFISVLLLIPIFMSLQACGSGGGTSDTSGTLTVSTATVSDNGDGTSLVTVTATYIPPAGKTAQGVVISIVATSNFGYAQSVNPSLNSLSNSVIQSFSIPQQLGTSTQVVITASIGGMTSGVLAIVPKFTPTTLAVPISVVNYTVSDLAGTDKFINFTGGTAPFTVVSSVLADINSTIFDSFTLGGGTIRIRLLNSNVNSVASTATVTVSDAAGGSVPITVNYFK